MTHPAGQFLIRAAHRHEAPAIVPVIDAALREFRAGVPPRIFEAYLAETSDISSRWGEAEVLVAERDGGIIGTVSFYPDASTEGFPAGWAGFRTLAVDPAARRLGIGRALMQACLDRARQHGAPVVGIHTGSFMTTAHRLYEAAGFRRSAEHDFRAAEVLETGDDAGDITVLGYRLDLAR